MSEVPGELPLLMGAAHGDPERLLLIGAPDARDMVQVRIWTSDDWSLPPRARVEPREGLLEWIETMARAGHTLNQSLTTVRHWLRDSGGGAATH